MLNFIILGYVPGTTYQITFNKFLVFSLIALGCTLAKWSLDYIAVRKNVRRIAAINLIAL